MEGLVARAYIRVSTDEQAQSGYSLMAQRERLESFAKSQGWTLAKVYEDDGYSAKDMNRPALQRMLKDAQPGEVILAYKLDRLTRSVLDLYELMNLFERSGVLFKSATEEFNTTTPHGRLMITLVAVLAQWERETIAERVKMGKQKKAANGEWPGGPIPFGYTMAPGKIKGGRALVRLVPDPNRAHIVREMFERYLNGVGIRGLALWLNDEARVQSATGGRWRVNTISKLLTNPVYCGDVGHGRRSDGPVTRVKGDHEPIVPREIFDTVQAMFESRKLAAPRHATGTYPLAGVAKCGVCGGPIASQLQYKTTNYYYQCLNWRQGRGCGDLPFTSIPGRLAEDAVVELIAGLQQPDRLDAFIRECEEEWAKKLGFDRAEVKRLESDLQETRQAINRWDHAYETGKLDFDDYLARVQPLKERSKAIQGRLEEAKETPAPPNREALVSTAIDFRKVWALAAPAERKALLIRALPAFGARIVLGRDKTVRLEPHVS